MSENLGADEIYCRSCGEPIKEKAEICPECGVRNAAASGTARQPSRGTGGRGGSAGGGTAGASRGQAGGQTGSQGQAAAAYDTEPSDSWALGVKAGTVLWGLILLLTIPTVLFAVQSMSAMGAMRVGRGMGSILGSAVFAALIPILQFVAWFLLPISLYLDLQYVDYHVDDWPLNGTLYVAGAALLPLVTQVLTVLSFFLGPAGVLVSVVVPGLLVYIGYNHLSTRSEVLPAEAA